MSNDANESETYGDDDAEDEGNTAPDHYSAGQRFGNTPAEEERGETFAQRLRQEEPESGDPAEDDSNRAAEEAAMHEVDE